MSITTNTLTSGTFSNQSVYSITATNQSSTIYTVPQDNSALYVQGNVKIDADKDLILGGHSLKSRLDKIEQRLGIVNRNSELESRWSSLRELGEQYRLLEAELLERELVWNTLKL